MDQNEEDKDCPRVSIRNIKGILEKSTDKEEEADEEPPMISIRNPEESSGEAIFLQNLVVTPTIRVVSAGAQVWRASSRSVPGGLSNRQRVPGSNIRHTGSIFTGISPLGLSPAGVRGAQMGLYPFQPPVPSSITVPVSQCKV